MVIRPDDLEARVGDETSGDGNDVLLEKNLPLIQRAKEVLKNFTASATAGWTFYTPIMVPIERYWADMEWDEVGKSRLASAFIGHLIGLPLYQKARKIISKRFNVTKESSNLAKRVVNAVAFMPVHPLTYGAMLAVAGTSWDEAKYALPAGLGTVMATSPVFAPFMEMWRTKVWGMEPTYNEESVQTEK